jgi:hypothetical protein
MGGLEMALFGGALLIGATGTWSPCGFSMIETIGPTGHTGGRRTTLAACLSFAPGAAAGGILTFGSLAAAGLAVHGEGGRLAYLLAAAIALAAALLEARGTPLVPQIRRQLPEHWRRLMPMPLAAALYGVLLGLGFSTFVLSFGVWALAGISFALGDPWAGLAIGLGFGVGRAAPIVLLAPHAGRPLGVRAIETMAARPSLYRRLRLGDALALALAAAALATTTPAIAVRPAVRAGADPSVLGGTLVYQRPNQEGVLRVAGRRFQIPGRDPAIGGPYVAALDEGRIALFTRQGLEPVITYPARTADAVAVSGDWLVWRTREDNHDAIHSRSIRRARDPGPSRLLVRVGSGKQLSAPSLDRGRIVYAVAGQRENRIVSRNLGGRGGGTILRSRDDALMTPSLLGGRLIYVRLTDKRQRLMIKRLAKGGKGRPLYSRRGGGTLHSTALSATRAYVTLLRGSKARILSTATGR